MKRFLIAIVVTGVLGLYGGSANAASFVAGTVTQAGTVTDNTTNLMWQQCTAGWNGAGCANDDLAVPNTYTWEAAITYCEGLPLGGFSDWRLPTVKELKSIADMTRTNPAIDAVYFPNTIALNYWSSTSYAAYTPNAWTVLFYNGNASDSNKTNTNYVRCVRGQ